MLEQLRGSFENVVDWWQCAAVMQREVLVLLRTIKKHTGRV
jgi:hypothetical protein